MSIKIWPDSIKNLVCFAIIIFNIFDCYSTAIVLSLGLAFEANPIAALAIEYMGVWAAAPKLILAIAGAVGLRYYWNTALAIRLSGVGLALLYTALVSYQVWMMAKLFLFAG